MPDIILPNLGIELPDIGSDADTWGGIINSALTIIDSAVQYDVISKTLSNMDVTLTAAEAASSVIDLSGTLLANVNVIVPATPVRLYLIRNRTSGAFTVILKTAAGTGVTVPQGTSTLVYSDGTNIIQGATSINNALTVYESAFASDVISMYDTAGVGAGRGSRISLGGISNDTGPVYSRFGAMQGLKSNGTQGSQLGRLVYQVNSGAGLVDAGETINTRFTKWSNDGTYFNLSGLFHEVRSDANNAVLVGSSLNTASGVSVYNSQLLSGAAGSHFVGTTNSVVTFNVAANGNVTNTSNSYGAISDLKFKDESTLVDAPSYLDRFMQVRFRKYNMIGSDLKQFGVVAQELELVFPGLVDANPDFEQIEVLNEETGETTTELFPNGEITKSVKYSVLTSIQGKVIQEQQAIITAQQDQINNILARLTAMGG